MPKSSLPTELSRLIVFKTDVGWSGFLQLDETLQQVKVGFDSDLAIVQAFQEFVDNSCDPRKCNRWESDLKNRMKKGLSFKTAHSAAKSDDFGDIAIDETWMTPFQQKVVSNCRKIKFGKTKSYGELAEAVGHGGAARAVGSVMSGNRFPIIVPCHRVVSSAGLGGFSSPRGLDTKRQLLAIEGHQEYATCMNR